MKKIIFLFDSYWLIILDISLYENRNIKFRTDYIRLKKWFSLYNLMAISESYNHLPISEYV